MDGSEGNCIFGNNVHLIPMDSNRNIIVAENLKIGLIGVDDLTVVVKGDSIMICRNPKQKDKPNETEANNLGKTVQSAS